METVHIHTVIGSVFGNVTQYISNGELNAQQQELNVEADGAHTAPAEAETEEIAADALPCDAVERKISAAITTMQGEGIFKHAYDYVWLMLVMNQTRELPHFDSTPSFHGFLGRIGVKEMPTLASLKKKAATAHRQHPSWTFTDTIDANETRRRNNVASRFLSLVRKGSC